METRISQHLLVQKPKSTPISDNSSCFIHLAPKFKVHDAHALPLPVFTMCSSFRVRHSTCHPQFFKISTDFYLPLSCRVPETALKTCHTTPGMLAAQQGQPWPQGTGVAPRCCDIPRPRPCCARAGPGKTESKKKPGIP